MLIGKSDDVQSICVRTLDNACPIYRHRNVRMSDLFERGIQISMLGSDLNVSLKLLVQKPVIDGNHITTLQVRRDFIDAIERSLIGNRFINLPLHEYKLVAVKHY